MILKNNLEEFTDEEDVLPLPNPFDNTEQEGIQSEPSSLPADDFNELDQEQDLEEEENYA